MRPRKVWLACGWIFVALVIYLSLNTNPLDAGRLEGVKVGHFAAYSWLMFWFSQIQQKGHRRAFIAIALVVMGVGLEYLQGFVGYRTFAYSDMGDNAIGVGAGWILVTTPAGRMFAAVESALLRRTKFQV
jgi:hypothetical protein